MFIEQLYTNCLAEAAYYIESNGEAAIIDPIRETSPYLEKLNQRNAKLKYVFETHFHADFVSGHIDLAKATGASIVFGPLADTQYSVINAKDNEVFAIGKLKIKVLHTPGHTPESTCYLLTDENGKDHCIFTGDTLFVGDVGRPDLLDGKMTKEELSGMLYDSLNNKIKPLANDVILYPAHGPGSACGKNIGKETWSTIGEQKQKNYALQPMSREKFIEAVTTGLAAPPAYFFSDAAINKAGYNNINDVMQKNANPLSISQVETELKNGALVLDTRGADEFEKGFIPGSVNIGLNGTFAVWVGSVIDINRKLIIVADEGKEQESILRLARVGYENVSGYVKGGVKAWAAAGKNIDTVKSISAEEFADRYTQEKLNVIDVRKPGEFGTCHLPAANLIELANINKNLSPLDKTKEYVVHCAGGYRSMVAASIMKAAGFKIVINVYGGMGAIKKTSLPLNIATNA